MQIAEEGVYDVPHDVYHADPVITPSLSAGIVKVMTGENATARHAWVKHPRFNPNWELERSERFNLGEAAHNLLLHDIRAFAVIDAGDYRTKTAKEAREKAYADGLIPILKEQLTEVETMVSACRAQLARHEDAGIFQIGAGEQSIFWREPVEGYEPVWCRCRPDWIHGENWIYVEQADRIGMLDLNTFKLLSNIFPDYKTTENAHPDVWGQRVCYNLGNDLRAAFYRRGIRRILGVQNPRYKFVVQEVTPPYAVCVEELEPEPLQVADAKVDAALHYWAWCLKNNAWPGYPRTTCGIPLPPWRAREWEEVALRNRVIAEEMEDREAMFKLGIAMQAPLIEGPKE